MSETGVIHNLPLKEYLARPGISKHHLDYLRVSPQTYWEYLAGIWLPKETGAMVFGRLLHAFVLEGRRDWVVTPETVYDHIAEEEIKWSGRKSACRAWVSRQTLPVLDGSEVADMELAATLVSEDPLAQQLLREGKAEASMFAKDEGLLLKSRPDWLATTYFAELKTTSDASTEEFSREIYRRRYHVQAAMNCKIAEKLGLKAQDWFFIILQKGDRPRLNVRKLAQRDIDLGMREIADDLKLLRECQKSGSWYGLSGPSGEIEEIGIPDSIHNRLEMDSFSLSIAGQKLDW